MRMWEIKYGLKCRLGEEKESASRNFQKERSEFEEKMKELLSQQDQLLQDRERKTIVFEHAL